MVKRALYFTTFTTLFFLLILPSLCAAPPIRFEMNGEKIEIKTDGRPWTEGFRHDAETKGVVEYVLPGEAVENWSELVTINYFKGMDGPDIAEKLVGFTKSGLERACHEVTWKILSQKPGSILYEWSVKNCSDVPDQSEIARILQGKQGLYVLHYASKKVPMPAGKHAAWFSLLSKARNDNLPKYSK